MAARPSPVLDNKDVRFCNKALRRKDSCSSLSNSRRGSMGSTVSTPGEDNPAAGDERRGNNRDRSATWDASTKDATPSKKSSKKQKEKSQRLRAERLWKEQAVRSPFPEEESLELRLDPPPDTCSNSDRETISSESEPENYAQRIIRVRIRSCEGKDDEEPEKEPDETK